MTIFNKNTTTSERSAIEYDERENFQDNLIDTSFFTKKIHRNQHISYGDL